MFDPETGYYDDDAYGQFEYFQRQEEYEEPTIEMITPPTTPPANAVRNSATSKPKYEPVNLDDHNELCYVHNVRDLKRNHPEIRYTNQLYVLVPFEYISSFRVDTRRRSRSAPCRLISANILPSEFLIN